MSGHSKWSTIKRKKGAADAARGKVFSRLVKEITVAAKQGGGDVDANPRLRSAVATAKTENMPADNIKRAIQRGTGELPGVIYEEVNYEGYGPGGVAVLATTATDNRNRTVAEMRKIFERSGGHLGELNSVAWMFTQMGVFLVDASTIDEDDLLAVALEAGADDLTTDSGVHEISTTPAEFGVVRDALESHGIKWISAELAMIPSSYIKLGGRNAERCMALMEKLEDHDDVQGVYTNADIDAEALEAPLMAESVRILGIDPGSRYTGYAVIDAVGNDVGVVDHGVVKLPQKQPVTERLKLLDVALREIVAEHHPDELVVEEVFAAHNVRSALVLGQVRGVVIVAAGSHCPVFEYSARAVKKAVAGYGQADKGQVAQMVKALLGLPATPQQDAADALALALCHMHSRAYAVRLQRAR